MRKPHRGKSPSKATGRLFVRRPARNSYQRKKIACFKLRRSIFKSSCLVILNSGAVMSFPKDSHQKAYVCAYVFHGTHPVLLVSRVDGDWSFLCGGTHPDDGSAYRVVGIGHVLGSDPALMDLHDLPSDWEAERENVGAEWCRSRFVPSKAQIVENSHFTRCIRAAILPSLWDDSA